MLPVTKESKQMYYFFHKDAKHSYISSVACLIIKFILCLEALQKKKIDNLI